MPRKKGGKAKGGGGSSKPRKPSKSDASMKKWKTAADVPLDEVDEFHTSKDKILLEGDGHGYMDGDEDDEVFALKGMADEEDSDDDAQGMDYDEDQEEEEEVLPTPAAKSKPKKGKKKAKQDESSDEDKEEEDEEETWGRGKAVYYNDNADQLESDDEEGHELEEQEAKRLQSKAREHMTDEDFGLQDVVDIKKDDLDLLEEPVAVVAPVIPTEPQDIIRHLEKTNPEALALARDWEDTAEDLLHTESKIKQVETETPNAPKLGLLHFHYQTLLSYASVLAFYIHLRAMPKYAQKPILLQSHPVMTQLLKLKRALITMDDLGFGATDDEDDDEDDEDFDPENSVLGGAEFLDWLTTGQLSGAIDDSDDDDEVETMKLPSKKESKKSKEPPKKKRKVLKDTEPTKPVFDLEEPEFVPTKKKASSRASADDDVYGEADFLQTADAADKSARKKSLQFHTSRIESASARRQSARSQAMGGDDDIPYKERQKQLALRAEQEAKKRLAQQGGEDLDDVDPEPPSRKRSRDGESDGSASEDGDSADEYYELVKKKSKEKKQKKKEDYDAARAEERVFEDDDASGPRSLTRAILKNKGLTPHRSKAVRNPRVKKRQKYDQAKKKLSSQKAIYKGGVSETKGAYGGEKSGISKVIKSVRLG